MRRGRIKDDRPPEDRFWKYVSFGSKEECWVWEGSKNAEGYGHFNLGDFPKQTTVRATAFIYEFIFGVIPKDKVVCHKCDNPTCVNPWHLFVGSMKDNTQDAIRKGRNIGFGYINKKGKNSVPHRHIRKMREYFDKGLATPRELAEVFNLSRRFVNEIVQRRAYVNVV